MYTFFKYINKIHAESLLEKGEILIRPLSEFQKVENFGNGIGDLNEGIVRFNSNGNVFDTNDPNHNKSVATLLSGNIQAGRVIIIAEKHIEFRTNNCFIFSVSQLANKSLLKEFGYDSCVKIEQFEDFFKILTDNLIKNGYKVTQAEVNECWYQKKEVDLLEELPYTPAFIKDEKYEYQKEVRCAWSIENCEEKPLIFTCPEIKKFCSLFKMSC